MSETSYVAADLTTGRDVPLKHGANGVQFDVALEPNAVQVVRIRRAP
jgi:hypothetical protein